MSDIINIRNSQLGPEMPPEVKEAAKVLLAWLDQHHDWPWDAEVAAHDAYLQGERKTREWVEEIQAQTGGLPSYVTFHHRTATQAALQWIVNNADQL